MANVRWLGQENTAGTGAMHGWIKIHRRLRGCPELRDPIARALWVDLLLMANHAPGPKRFRGLDLTLERGQLATSLRQLEADTGIPVQRLRALIARFAAAGMVKTAYLTNTETHTASNTASNTLGSLITICNYDAFQAGADEPAQLSTQLPTQLPTHTNKKNKNLDSSANAEGGSAPPSARKVLWDEMVRCVTETGHGGGSEKAARTLIGKWLANYDDGTVFAAHFAATRPDPMGGVKSDRFDYVAYVGGILRTKPKKAGKGNGAQPPKPTPRGGQPLPTDRKREIDAKLREEGLNPFTVEGMARRNQLTEEMTRDQRHAAAA